MVVIKAEETRLEIALKVFHWSPEVADLVRVAKELNLTAYEFNNINDEEFFRELFMYVHERDTSNCVS